MLLAVAVALTKHKSATFGAATPVKINAVEKYQHGDELDQRGVGLANQIRAYIVYLTDL